MALLCSAAWAHAQNVHGVLRVVKGDVQVKSGKDGQLSKARIGSQVFPKDVIITGKDARAKIVMVDNNEINVSPESQVEIQHYEFDPNAGKKDVLLNVIYGKVRSKVEQKYDGKSAKFQIKTPSAVAGVRGTDFLASFDRSANSSQVVTFQGKVEFGTPGPGGTISNPVFVTPGNSATSVGGGVPTPPAPVPKSELAKMDNESKADTPANAGNKNESSRQPSNDKNDKNDGDKKDEGKKDSGGSNGNKDSAAGDKKEDSGAKKNDGGGKSAAAGSPGAGGAKPGETASADGGGGTAGAPRGPASDGTASPGAASSPGAGAPPPPGGSMVTIGDTPAAGPVTGPGNGPTLLAPPGPAPINVIPTTAQPQVIPVCDYCNSIIQNQNSKVNINIRTGI